MQSSANIRIPDSTQSGRSLIKTRKSRGPKTVPCGTPLSTWMLSDVAPFTVTCRTVSEKCPDPFKSAPSYTIMTHLSLKAFVRYAIECLREIKHYQVMLLSLI